ncbi:MAG: hypothetical protein AAB889_03670, partial [Patescibacteria group bacterium]
LNDVVVQNKPSLPIILSIDKVPNLVEQTSWNAGELKNWSITEEKNVKIGQQNTIGNDLITLVIAYNFLSNTSGVIRDIPQWEEESMYALSFDYLTYDQNFSMILHERGGTKTNKFLNKTYEETFRSKEWKKLSTVVLSAKNAQSAYLQIVKAQDDYEDVDGTNIKKIEIKNLLVQKISNPKIVFKKVLTMKETLIPRVTFTKINPTKYKVVVRDAKNPYTLVLSQSFSQKWKLFFPRGEQEAKTFKGIFARFMGNFLKIIIKPFISGSVPEDSRVVASYANGSIQEGIYKSTLLDANTFETWGQDPIAEATHLPVNGYANSWYIEPRDVQNRNDYTLIIEMTSQKLFYGSLFLSIGAFFFVLLMFVLSLARIRK